MGLLIISFSFAGQIDSGCLRAIYPYIYLPTDRD